MKEFLSYLIFIGLALLIIAVTNELTNNIKQHKCQGTFVKNISDAGQSTCITEKKNENRR